MDLGDFLADDTLGGSLWADEDVDFSAIGSTAAVTTAAVPSAGSGFSSGFGSGAAGGSLAFGRGGDDAFPRRERKEYPVPDAPPYRAMVLNLPWEANDFGLQEFFETLMDGHDLIKDIDIPRDRELDRIRGFAFVEFHTREMLEEALKTLNTEYIGRRIFVSVAAPKNDGWSRVGGSRFGDDVDLDWGAARSSRATLPPRERGERPMRSRPVDDGPELDWGSARGSGQLPPREPRGERTFRPKRDDDGPDLDWGSARGSGQLPPREPRERTFRPKRDEGPDLDWLSARGSGQLPPRRAPAPRRDDAAPKRTEPELDWSRGQRLPPRRSAAAASAATGAGAGAAKADDKKKEDKPQLLLFAVLAVDDDDDDAKDETHGETAADADVADVATKVALLAVEEPTDDGWEVVGK